MTGCPQCAKGGWAACVCGGRFLDWQGLTPGARPRAILEPFAQALEQTLRRNDHKPDWRPEPWRHLAALLSEEVEEVKQARIALHREPYTPPADEDLEALASEALDVAACALFFWAKAKGIGKDRGRSL